MFEFRGNVYRPETWDFKFPTSTGLVTISQLGGGVMVLVLKKWGTQLAEMNNVQLNTFNAWLIKFNHCHSG
jgi:hypothetical protein